MSSRFRAVVTIGLPAAALMAAVASPRAQDAPPSAAAAARQVERGEMQSHYADAILVHDALVRGDLAGAREAAKRLGARAEAGIPEKAASYVTAMQQAAARVAGAGDIGAASTSAAAMLGTCGDCHRDLGAMPAVSIRYAPAVGQTVGHMLDHQRATEQLMEGLVVPSASAWHEGAQALRVAPLGRGRLPKDPKLTGDLMAGEKHLHELADRAAAATGTPERTAVYGEMIGTCAACHSLHAGVWGPGGR